MAPYFVTGATYSSYLFFPVFCRKAMRVPSVDQAGRITFLVESNGSETFWTARRQLLFSLPEWPMSLHVAESQSVHVFNNKETW